VFQVITMWNLSKPDKERTDNIKKIKYRGYKQETYLTAQFANKISNGDIRPLSVSDIADKLCPNWRDLYYRKGSNRNYRKKGSKTWGQTAGRVSQKYIASLFLQYLDKRNVRNYTKIIRRIDDFSILFKKRIKEDFQELNKIASKEYEDPHRLLQVLEINGRIEIGIKLMHTILSQNRNHMNLDDLLLEFGNKQVRFYPNPVKIGINRPSTPDFFIERFKVVGDIKTGVFFDERYLLTCAGYALAYENWKKNDINWGIIYFLPTRIPTEYAKPVTYAQLYIFPIDDTLRGWFLEERDIAYRIVSRNCPPGFPPDKERCKKCKYENICQKMGLDI